MKAAIRTRHDPRGVRTRPAEPRHAPCSDRRLWRFALLAGLLLTAGCGSGEKGYKATRPNTDSSAQWSDDLFGFALENLNHLEDNDCMELMRSTNERLDALQLRRVAETQPPAVAQRMRKIADDVLPDDSVLASWPEPSMLRQVVSRLNQWVDIQDKPGPWQPDPMLATLPADLRGLPMLAQLGQAHFTALDGYMLMEAVWTRDAGRWAKGNSSDELLIARNIFDWVVRNIQLDAEALDHEPQTPWETLFLGHGTAAERAWTYILLLRQQGIDAAMVALPTAGTAASLAEGQLRPWCVGVLIGGKAKQLYLFDPRLGAPIPGPGGVATDSAGRLDVQPATLRELVADPKLLGRMALGADQSYWVKPADLSRVVILLEASPLYVQARSRRIESRLVGARKLVLSAEPSQQAARFQAAGFEDVRLWQLPYATLHRRLNASSDAVGRRLVTFFSFIGFGSGSLYKARVLHLKGRFFDERGAIAYYQRARPRSDAIREEGNKLTQVRANEFLEYCKSHGREMTLAEARQVAQAIVARELSAILRGKIDASYWLGLIEYEQGQFASALDYFDVRTLQYGRMLLGGNEVHCGPGARYNIGRTYEMVGDRAKAVQEYRSSVSSPDKEAGLLRARWLTELADGDGKRPAAKEPDDKPSDPPVEKS